MFISIIRVIKFSLQDILRNIWLSLVTVIILILALFSVNLLLTVKVIGQGAIDAIKDKIDVNLYIKTDAPEDRIMALKAKISNLPQAREVVYVSKSQAIEDFREHHKNNPEILEALRELGNNPLNPSLIIKPKDANKLDDLIASINNVDDSIIESRNFSTYKQMLKKINAITDKITDAGMVVSGIFIFITLLVVYNSVRVAIYTHRKEIMIMRLVGASDWFVYMPFVVSSLIFTFVGVAGIVLVYYSFLTLLQPYLEAFFIGYNLNIISYFNANFWQIFGLEFLIAGAINVVASLIAVGKYARV